MGRVVEVKPTRGERQDEPIWISVVERALFEHIQQPKFVQLSMQSHPHQPMYHEFSPVQNSYWSSIIMDTFLKLMNYNVSIVFLKKNYILLVS